MKTFECLVEDMLDYRESMGYSRNSYESFLRNLSVYVEQNIDFDGYLMIKDIEPWCRRRDSERVSSYSVRMSGIRQFTYYLCCMGLCDGIPSRAGVPIQHTHAEPYSFSDSELRKFFEECDKARPNFRNPLYQDIISLIYRLTYFCGLRPNEGRELLRDDVNLKDGTLHIRKNKQHKERLIPMAEDVTAFCAEYAKKRDVLFADSTFFFPASEGTCYSSDWLRHHFLALWAKAFPDKKDCGVRVYDLRHRFATTIMASAIERGENLYAFIPYMSAYMGHTSYRDTVENFLSYMENKYDWSVATRNNKLAAIRSFFKYCGENDISVMNLYNGIALIPHKKGPEKEIEFFSEKALEAILAAPDTSTKKGIRDLTLMMLLYDSAARVQELLDIRIKDLHLGKNADLYVILTGKGRKTRRVPLMEKTAEHLKNYIRLFHENVCDDDHLFFTVRNGEKNQMSRENVAKMISEYATIARKGCLEVPEHVYPHMFRHSRAMHLFRNGMPLEVVSMHLGHKEMETTIGFYANADTNMISQAIQKATSKLNPLITSKVTIDIKYDRETKEKLLGLRK